MPVRFRCYFCMQLLTIGQRKAGTVIQCPRCQGQVWVPDPDNPAAEQPAGAVPPEIILVAVPDPTQPAARLVWLSPRQVRVLLLALVLVLVFLFGVGVWVGRVCAWRDRAKSQDPRSRTLLPHPVPFDILCINMENDHEHAGWQMGQ